jgi:hypothetical protein
MNVPVTNRGTLRINEGLITFLYNGPPRRRGLVHRPVHRLGEGRRDLPADLGARRQPHRYTTNACCLRISPGSAWACGACSKPRGCSARSSAQCSPDERADCRRSWYTFHESARMVQICCHCESLHSSGGVGRRRNSRSPAERARRTVLAPCETVRCETLAERRVTKPAGSSCSHPHPPMCIVLLSTPLPMGEGQG